MKTLKGTLAAIAIAGLCVGASLSASATLILYTTSPDGPGIDNAIEISGAGNPTPGQVLEALGQSYNPSQTFLPADYTQFIIYKNDLPAESGMLPGSYSISFQGLQNQILTIENDQQLWANTSLMTYLLLKDGQEGHWLWNLTSPIWDGKETIEFDLLSIWSNTGKLSHLEIGVFRNKNDDRPPVVPEPATVAAGMLLLLPFGVSAVRIMRRKV